MHVKIGFYSSMFNENYDRMILNVTRNIGKRTKEVDAVLHVRQRLCRREQIMSRWVPYIQSQCHTLTRAGGV